MFARIRQCLIAAVAAALAAAPAYAIPWSQPSGSNGAFTWSNGGSDNGLFGSPTVVGNSFLFFPSSFVATSSNGVAQTTSDRLYFTLEVPAGQSFQGIKINEAGDYSILGTGSVTANAFLFITNLDNGNLSTATMLTTPSMPISVTNGAVSGLWSGLLTTTLPNGTRRIQVVMNNILQATSGPNGTATIAKKSAGVELQLIIPEPAIAGTVILAGLGMLTRRRRSA
jgi:hypothetical protein